MTDTVTELDRITWVNVRIRLGDLTAWDENPRYSTTNTARRLTESLDDFGQVETVAIGPAPYNNVYNGHQRLSAWLNQFGPDFEVDARQSSRELTDDERRKLVMFLHEGATGEWDFAMLGNLYDPAEVVEWGADWMIESIEWQNDNEEVDFGEFATPSDVDIRYKLIIENLNLAEANELKDANGERDAKVEQYRVQA